MARLNVISAPAVGFDFIVDGTSQKTPYYKDYPDGATVTISWPPTQTISSRGLLLTKNIEFTFQRMYWDKNVVEERTASITLSDAVTNVTGVYRRSKVSVKGPLGIWFFPIISKVFSAPRLALE